VSLIFVWTISSIIVSIPGIVALLAIAHVVIKKEKEIKIKTNYFYVAVFSVLLGLSANIITNGLILYVAIQISKIV
jgi:hypothetical protein